jgi:hypothetical protein
VVGGESGTIGDLLIKKGESFPFQVIKWIEPKTLLYYPIQNFSLP